VQRLLSWRDRDPMPSTTRLTGYHEIKQYGIGIESMNANWQYLQ
jgi:hypothetical protein